MAPNPKLDNQQILVLYHYFEKDQSYINNFAHFLRFGYDSTLNYLVIIAGECSLECWADRTKRSVEALLE